MKNYKKILIKTRGKTGIYQQSITIENISVPLRSRGIDRQLCSSQ